MISNPVLYGGFALACLLVYYKLEAPQNAAYDYWLTLAAGLQTLGFVRLTMDTSSSAVEGLSEKTLWAFVVAHVTRISTTIWGEGYIPEDNTGDVFLYQGLEVASVLMLIFQVMRLSAVRSSQDVGQGVERWSQLIVMCGLSAVLAFYTKSTGHDDYWADLSWMFAIWLEAFALGPQVHLLYTGASRVDESAQHFAGLTLASAVVHAAFWGRVAHDRWQDFEKEGAYNNFFMGITVACLLKVGMCGAYFVLFNKTVGRKPDYELCAADEL
eukprot:TRINITY_DN83395_c0_g1_i1.p1 TRINITY_DN83395_c0_g1~~TRINITY_DN83395_c0_g1_i1.p1  ORF type:complete len:270 (+),score=54.53 TRINITY_DN83395_c0_g1_i1:80-889(+)